MKKWGILTSLLLVLLVVQTPQFAQDTSQLPLKYYGFGQEPGAGRRAFLADGDAVYIVAEGDVVLGRYRIIKINNRSLEFEEIGSGRHGTARLEDPGTAHRRQLAIELLRTINTAEVTYHSENGSYATWQTLLSSDRQYFDDFVARYSDRVLNFGQLNTVTRNILPPIQFTDPPEILPGWNLRLNVHSNGQGYDLLLKDMTDEQCGYAVLTDENGVIRQSKAIDCQI